ncbi:MAG: N-acetylmuramoyl-L-alanine amidase [Actinomycetes bacterium]
MRFPRPRPAGALLTIALVVPMAVVAPTFSAAPPQPHPVTPSTERVALRGVDAAAFASSPVPTELGHAWRTFTGRGTAASQRAMQRTPQILTGQVHTDGFRMLGVTWRGARPSDDGTVVVTARTHTDGTWTDWFDVPINVDLGTEPSPNGRYGAEPYWVGDSDGIQVRVDAVGAANPRDVRADLIEPGTSDADASITGTWQGSSASASTDEPPIVTRAQWGANESLRDKHLENSSTFKVAFVHHTAGSNNYTRSESPAVVRGLYSYYVNTLHYADMGYNFLVDKFGTIYEGRAGSITKPVRSAATGGFNTDTLSIVAIGNFQTARATDALVSGIAKVAAYRLSRFYRDPFGHKTLKAEVGSSRYAAGTKVRFKVISGHRDSNYTACPGNKLYRRLPDIRRLAAKDMGSSFIEPSISRKSVALGHNTSFRVHAGVTQQQNWALTVRPRCGHGVVRRITGTASRSNPINAVWRGFDDQGRPVPAGRYRVTLTSSADGTSAWPFATGVVIGVGGDAKAATRSSMPAPAGAYVPQRPQALLSTTTGQGVGTPMVLGAGRRLDVPVLGRAGVPKTGVSAVALSIEASCASNRTRVFAGPASVEGVGSRVLSVGPNNTARSFALVRVGPGGSVRLQNARGNVALRASVVGYISTDGAGGSLTPLRRSPLAGASPIGLGTTASTVNIAGRAGVPSDAKAVVLVVRRGPKSKVSSVWAWPESGTRPSTPAWRRTRGPAAVSQFVVPLGSTGALRLAADHSGPVSLQVAGYVAGNANRPVHAVVPRPLLGDGVKVAKGKARTVKVSGRAGVPNDATAVVVSVTGAAEKRSAQVTVWPRGSSEPTTSDLMVPRHRSSESVAVIRIGRDGDLRLSAKKGTVHGNLTVLGWVR